jgi:polar amino acid transport system substrate-binding protein
MVHLLRTLALLSLAALPASAQAPRTVRITNGEWPPYLSASAPDKGELSHVVELAFEHAGVKVEYGFFPWPRALMLAKVGEWDGSVAWARSAERERDFFFSEPIAVSETVLYHLKAKRIDWSDVGDLAHYRIGISRGYFYGDAFAQAVERGQLVVESVAQDEINLRKLLAGRIDVFPIDKRVAAGLLHQHFTPADVAQLDYHPKPLYIQTVHLMLSRANGANRQLMEQFNRGLKKLRDSGQVEALPKP